MRSLLASLRNFLKSLDIVTVLLCLACSTISMCCLFSFYEAGERSLRVLIVQGGSILVGLGAALFISLLEISFNLFGNGLRDAFNPSLRGAE